MGSTKEIAEQVGAERCTELLQSQTVGRIVWQSADGPEILPVNYAWHEDSVIFRTAADGPLADLDRPTDVAFEIDEVDQVRRQGWRVVVHGQAEAVAEPTGWCRCGPWPMSPGPGVDGTSSSR